MCRVGVCDCRGYIPSLRRYILHTGKFHARSQWITVNSHQTNRTRQKSNCTRCVKLTTPLLTVKVTFLYSAQIFRFFIGNKYNIQRVKLFETIQRKIMVLDGDGRDVASTHKVNTNILLALRI